VLQMLMMCIAECSLEMIDKVEAPAVVDGYGLSVAFVCMLDVVKSIESLVQPVAESTASSTSGPDVPSSGLTAEAVSPPQTGITP